MTPGGAEARAARPEETDTLLHVLCAAFGLSYDAARPIFYADPFFDLSHKRILRTPQAGLVSCLTVIPTRIRVGAAWVAMGGIAGVATLPPCQGRGHAGHLLTATVPALATELGYPLAGLFAYSEDYYRRFGWEIVSLSAGQHGLIAELPHHAEAGQVRILDDADTVGHGGVHALHAALTAGRTGACARDDRRWRIIGMAPVRREWALYQDPPEPPSGYAIYELAEGADGNVLHILEMHAATPAARRGLAGHLARQRERAVRWDWPAAGDDWAASGLPATPDAGPPGPGLMLRLTDTAGALSAVHAANLAPVLTQTGRTLTVRAVDALRPENARPVRLTASGVVMGSEADPDWIAADVRALAQCYFGHRIPSALQAQGALQASSPAALALADLLFPARSPFVAPLDQF